MLSLRWSIVMRSHRQEQNYDDLNERKCDHHLHWQQSGTLETISCWLRLTSMTWITCIGSKMEWRNLWTIKYFQKRAYHWLSVSVSVSQTLSPMKSLVLSVSVRDSVILGELQDFEYRMFVSEVNSLRGCHHRNIQPVLTCVLKPVNQPLAVYRFNNDCNLKIYLRTCRSSQVRQVSLHLKV